MEKTVILLIALMVVSVGLLSGCTDTTSVDIADDYKFHHQWFVPAVTKISSDADEVIDSYENNDEESLGRNVRNWRKMPYDF